MNWSILQMLALLMPNLGLRRSYYLLEIDDSNYEAVLKKIDVALVFFYREPCKECETMLPEMSETAEKLAHNNPPISVATVNCSGISRETCVQRDVKYEYTYVVRHGKLYQRLDQELNATSLAAYMPTQLGPSIKRLKTLSQIENLLRNDSRAVVAGFFPKTSRHRRVFKSLAHHLRDHFLFTLTVTLKKEEIVLFHPLHMRNKLENDTDVYEGVFNEETITPWIFKKYDGLVKLRTKDTWDQFKNPLVVVYFDLDYERNFRWFKYVHTRMVKAALPYKGYLNIGMSPKKDFESYEIQGYPQDDFLVVGMESTGNRYLMGADFSFETVEKFISAFLHGQLTPYAASEPLPKHNDGLIKVVVKLNFNDLVLNNGKDTLILFYEDVCPACVEFLPVYDVLAAELKEEDLVIVKTDVGKNPLPAAYRIEDSIPTVGLALRNSKDKKPLIYHGPLNVDDLIKFVAKRTVTQLKKFDRMGNVRPIKIEL